MEAGLSSYFYSTNYAFIWTTGMARLPRSRFREVRSRLPGWKFLYRDESSKIPQQGIFNNCQNNISVKNCPGKRDEIFSYRRKGNSYHLPGCLAKRASTASI